MAGDKRILIDLLLETSSTRQAPSAQEDVSESIRAAFLINSSSSPQSCSLVDGLEYRTVTRWQGLTIRNTDRPISDAFEHLSHLPDIPCGLAEAEPVLKIQDLQAAMLLISRILAAFEHPE